MSEHAPEMGSRNQRPPLDMARSADILPPTRFNDPAPMPDYAAGRVRPSVLRQVISEAMNRAEAAGMDRRTTEEWIGIEILGSPLIPLATEVPLWTGEVECADVERSWFQQEYERSKKRNGALGAHGMVITGTGFDVPTRVLPPAECDHLYPPANRDGTCPSCGKPRVLPPGVGA